MKMFTLPKILDFNHKKNSTDNIVQDSPEFNVLKAKDDDKLLIENNEQFKKEDNLIGTKVEDGKIIVLNQNNSDEEIQIMSCNGINLYINGEKCLEGKNYIIRSEDNITYDCMKIESSREIKISTDKSNMKAYISVKYNPEYIYKLVDQPLTKKLLLNAIKEKSGDALKFTNQELINALIEQNIRYGIISEALVEVAEGNSSSRMLVAKGLDIVEDIPSRINLKFNENARREIDDKETVDFKEWHTEINVQVGDVIAEIIPRQEGENGKNIFGEELKRKTVRDTPIRVGKNCHLENNKVIADLNGRPTFKNQVVSVFNSYEIEDVDLTTGNINFSGDVVIGKNVQEGMIVRAGNSLLVGGSVYSSKIIVNGDATIRGNIIDSNMISGEVDIVRNDYLDHLQQYRDRIIQLIDYIEKIVHASISEVRIGEVANTTIEKRLKDIPKLSLSIITFNISREVKNSPLLDFIRNKILGFNILNLESISELRYLIQVVDTEIIFWNESDLCPINVDVKYCQKTTIKSTGNIIITGQGEYNCNLHSLHNIIFENPKSVARGGVIRAEGDLVLGSVGSHGNVSTRLEVPETGKITAKIVYTNTIIKIGKYERVIEEDCKNLEAYIGEDGEIFIVKSPL